MKYGSQAIKDTLEKGGFGGSIYGDMDHLKKINDELGHDMGDIAIQAEVSLLKQVLFKSCVIGRLGGDEFAMVVPNLNEERFKSLIKKLDLAAKHYNQTSGQPFTLSISLGATFFSPEENDLAVLLKRADEKQYEQKRLHHAARG